MQGLYFEFEGVDGCGKSTILGEVAEKLRVLDIPVLVTREPGSPLDPVTKNIREMLKWGDTEKPCPEAELYLFAADRAQHINRVIKPALKAGKVVLQDRGIWSTVAYQGDGRGQSIDLIWQMNDFSTSGLNPHAIFFIDTPLDVTLKRARRGREDQIETFSHEEFQRKVYDSYQKLAAYYKESAVKRLSGTHTIGELTEEVLDYILAAIARGFLPSAVSVR
jgi:dTMP kinase